MDSAHHICFVPPVYIHVPFVLGKNVSSEDWEALMETWIELASHVFSLCCAKSNNKYQTNRRLLTLVIRRWRSQFDVEEVWKCFFDAKEISIMKIVGIPVNVDIAKSPRASVTECRKYSNDENQLEMSFRPRRAYFFCIFSRLETICVWCDDNLLSCDENNIEKEEED